MKLCERVSQNCLVIGDSVYHRPGVLKSETLSPTFKTSAIVLRATKVETIYNSESTLNIYHVIV